MYVCCVCGLAAGSALTSFSNDMPIMGQIGEVWHPKECSIENYDKMGDASCSPKVEEGGWYRSSYDSNTA